MAGPEFLTHAVAGWASLFGNSKVVSTGVTYVHLAGLLVGGGAAVEADRQILRASAGEAPERAACMTRVPTVHRTIVVSLAVVALSGILMFLSDLETFAGSVLYWIKMAFVVLLVVNGVLLLRGEAAVAADDSARNWARLRMASLRSLALWAVVLLLGTLLRTTA